MEPCPLSGSSMTAWNIQRKHSLSVAFPLFPLMGLKWVIWLLFVRQQHDDGAAAAGDTATSPRGTTQGSLRAWCGLPPCSGRR